jgi:hypothetical protein
MGDAYDDMSGPQLVAAWNKMAEEANVPNIKPVGKFENREIGARRCRVLRQAIIDGDVIPLFLRRIEDPKPKTDMPATQEWKQPSEEDLLQREADARWRNWRPTDEHPVRPRKSTFVKMLRRETNALKDDSGVADMDNASRHRRADRIVRVLCANPRQRGTPVHAAFEKMLGGPTVGEYLAKFNKSDRGKAVRWLSNAVRDGFVKLLG